MARILFVVENPHSKADFITRQATALIDSMGFFPNEIKVLTNENAANELSFNHTNIEILRPFKSWKLWEAPQLVVPLYNFRPQILHFIQPFRNKVRSINHAIWTLPAMVSWPKPPLVATSFFDLNPYKKHKSVLKAICYQSSTISVANQMQKQYLFSFFKKKKTPPIEILPLTMLQNQTQTSGHWPPASFTDGFVNVLGPIRLDGTWPLTLSMIEQLAKNKPNMGWIFIGALKHLSINQKKRLMGQLYAKNLQSQVLFLTEDTETLRQELICKSSLVHLGNLDPADLELSYYLQFCLEQNKTVLLLDAQDKANIYSAAIHNQRIIIDNSFNSDIAKIVTSLQKKESQSENSASHIIPFEKASDTLGNCLNRYYRATPGSSL